MINIEESHLVGKGHHREVYRHPNNEKLCIKIIFDGNINSPEIDSEKSYYRHLQNRKISWDMLPVYHGDVITNLGDGTVFDLITDDDNNTSKTLGHYLSSDELTGKHCDELVNGLHSLKDYLLSERVITKGLAHRNIVCQKIDSKIVKLYIVDNIGNSEFIPISNYVGFRARKKITKKWHRFEQSLLSQFPDNIIVQRMVNL